MSRISRIIYFLLSIVFFVFMDIYATEHILKNDLSFANNPIFNLVYVKNTGAAFNIFQDSKVFLILFAIFAITGISCYIFKHIEKYSGIFIFFNAILCAGIICNMYERLSLGYVRDYIKLNFINFPIFNISDIFINISVFAIIIIIAKNSYKRKK